MKRTSAATLIVLALFGAGAGALLNQILTVTGRTTFTPTPLLAVLLVVVGAIVLALAWPVRRSIRTGVRIDPFRALRAVTLARASSLLGAMMSGFGAGMLMFLLARPIDPPVGSTVTMIALVASGVVLVIASLVAEQFCTLPKDPDDSEPREPASDPGPPELSGGH
jgi:hypothetical protein